MRDSNGLAAEIFFFNFGGHGTEVATGKYFEKFSDRTNISVRDFDVPGVEDQTQLYRTLSYSRQAGADDVAIDFAHGSAYFEGTDRPLGTYGFRSVNRAKGSDLSPQFSDYRTISGEFGPTPPGLIILAACNSLPGMAQDLANASGRPVLGLTAAARIDEYLNASMAAAQTFINGGTPQQAADAANKYLVTPCYANLCGPERPLAKFEVAYPKQNQQQ